MNFAKQNFNQPLIFSVFLLVLSIIFFINTSGNKSIDFSKVIDYNKIYFAGEKVPLDGNYEHNKQKFERELIITVFNTYQFMLYHKREGIYFPYIEKKLKENGIPDDFKYLAVAESALKNDSVSSVGAGGIWQFMPETAKSYGLIVNEYVDERYNFEKSTDAAILHIKSLYADFKNRTLVAAAYNRGGNGIKRALDDQHVSRLYDLYLNEETDKYIWRILAIKYVMENRYKLIENYNLGEKYQEPKYKIEKVGKIDNLKDWSTQKGYIYASIKELNPWIVKDSLPNGNREIKIPVY
ncbi:MAG: lytic transglycosylase domain-containing protein [Candidatus Gracilibacteria bacterium]|nr:lytic transglycosylase domain-containing protein [Candidatus Gracilibacteria bacterium]MDD4530943.1 lytic transglycosylase domain-containing protein [Candidatus Gracilibacteria bacterium]